MTVAVVGFLAYAFGVVCGRLLQSKKDTDEAEAFRRMRRALEPDSWPRDRIR